MTPEPALFQTSGPVFLLYHICWDRGGERERGRRGKGGKSQEGESKERGRGREKKDDEKERKGWKEERGGREMINAAMMTVKPCL